ncbi:DUF2716 domain-containing protein [uncultured Anaerofustis sp.]|nr:DUF2716 domain-containing protein [uncultured Anaerofustis sp.]
MITKVFEIVQKNEDLLYALDLRHECFKLNPRNKEEIIRE